MEKGRGVSPLLPISDFSVILNTEDSRMDIVEVVKELISVLASD